MQCLADGALAGAEAATGAGFAAAPVFAAWRRSWGSARRGAELARSGSGGKAFVDFQNDVTVSDVELAHREGYGAAEHLKRYTTLGMATDQGKTANVAGAGAHRRAHRPHDPRGRRRPCSARPIRPCRYRRAGRPAIAARSSGRTGCRRRTHGRRSTARCSSRPARGCVRSISARPARRAGCRASTARRATVRQAVGVCDVSTLGKIDVQGAGRRSVPRPRLRQHILDAAGRQRALWPDAARGRLRARRRHRARGWPSSISSPRPRRQTRRKVLEHCEFCHQVLWPELDVQIGLGDRAMGAVRGRGPALARRAGKARCDPQTTSATRRCPTWACARS